jgi:leucyl aminopeptidase (aminopeptidase T)
MENYPGALKIVQCLGIKKSERVIILSDNLSFKKPIYALTSVCRQFCKSADVDFSLPKNFAPEIPKRLRKKLLSFDVIILCASQSWYHGPFRRKLKYYFKKRIAEGYGLSEEQLKNGALCADYQLIGKINAHLKRMITAGGKIRITSTKGTEFSAVIKCSCQESGAYGRDSSGGNLPAGEISCAIFPKSAKGNLVFDLSFDTLGRLKSPLHIKIEQGSVTEVTGWGAKQFMRLLVRYPQLKKVTEVGIGTNPFSILGRSIIEDEKKLGTVHIGFGNNTYFGGNILGPHYDGVLTHPNLEIGKKRVIGSGELAREIFSPAFRKTLRRFNILS